MVVLTLLFCWMRKTVPIAPLPKILSGLRLLRLRSCVLGDVGESIFCLE
ncbi:hypothetical protein MtrunA17_Chr2g0329001 [Medicago truncatula]|uniref:Transmembrane protein n=1 Tax=Medicago truncatula TaxID=3880 RepID=A0A396JMA1_MEDTR|nr:hypothetical protein MtrunA17_Chr2g0329001 [Medicago truncatula]